MATTKKSPKAKTKKSAVKVNKSKVIEKNSRVLSKSPSASASIQTSSKVRLKTTTQLLKKLNIVSAAVSLILAVLAGLFINNKSFELVNGLLTKNELSNISGNNLVPAVHHLFDVELRWIVVVTLVLSAILPLLWLTAFKVRYSSAVKSKINLLRWIDTAVISALIIEVIALISGVQDLFTLKLLAGLMIVTCLLGWISEKRNTQANRPVRSELLISIFTGTLPWILIASYAVSTWLFGRVTSPSYVYILYGGVLLGFIAHSINLVNYVRRFRRWTNYEFVERNYLIIGIAIKLIFAVTIIVGLKK